MKYVHTLFCCWGLLLAGLAAHADEVPLVRVSLRIDEQPVRAALKEFSDQSGVQVLLRLDNTSVEGVLAPKVEGRLTVQAALSRLLQNAALEYEFVNDRTVRISAARDNQPSDPNSHPLVLARAQTELPQASGQVQTGSPVSGGTKPSETHVDQAEVVVTAQKKAERLQDVPVPVSVLNPQKLADTGQVLLRDYAATVPGFSVTPYYDGVQVLSIRGITTGGFSQPTVGVVIDGVPFGSSTANANIVPDIDPGDLERIEMLRGPQGTLYGANSMVGLVNYVTKDPSVDHYDGHMEVGTSGVRNGSTPGFNLRAAVNVPLNDTMAIRLSGYTRQDPGYINNPILNLKGVNEAETSGGMFSALWRPSEDFTGRFTTIYQYLKNDGVSEVDVPTTGYPRTQGLGDLQQNYIAGVGGSSRRIQSDRLKLDYKLGSLTLTSLTGFNKNSMDDSYDYTPGLGTVMLSMFGAEGAPFTDQLSSTDVSEELRIAGPVGRSFEVLAGAIYLREVTHWSSQFHASNPQTGQFLLETVNFGDFGHQNYREYAGFADLTYHVTDRFDVQVGGRETHLSDFTYPQTVTGPLTEFFYDEPSPYTGPPARSSSDTFTYLVTPRFIFSPDLMVYARLASGFRPGGGNYASPDIPPQFHPDRIYNYEIGAKGDFLDHMFSFDASLYYINWENIQFQLYNEHHFVYSGNGGSARSDGVELSLTARPVTGLTLAGWVTYDDAVLAATETNTPDLLAAGMRLPYASRWSGNLSLNQEFPVRTATGFVGANINYVGDRLGTFQPTSVRQYYPAYTKTDLRAGVRYESWTTSVYVNNVADVRTYLDGGIGFLWPFAYIPLQPRTVGLSVSKTF